MSFIENLMSKWYNLRNRNNKVLRLIRYHMTGTETLGLLFVDGEFVCYTLELPWKNNERDISCIPEDTYTVVPHKTDPNKFRVKNVPGRSGINIEIGNSYKDILGCILVGTGVTSYLWNYGGNSHYYLVSSKIAMYKLKEIIGDSDCILHVTNIAKV